MKLYSIPNLIFAISLQCLIGATSLSAMEIQCKTQNQEYDFVLKTSPESKRSYALLLSEERLESYEELLETQFTYGPGSFFELQSEAYSISINLIEKQGWSSLLLSPMMEKLELSLCTEHF